MVAPATDALSDRMERLLAGRICILGIGNRACGDDGCGSLLAEHLQACSGVVVIDAGAVPENYLEMAARSRPDTILLIDAVDFGGAPGEARVLDPEEVGHAGLSTHVLSLRMTIEFLRARTDAKVVLLGIQPALIDQSERLSEPVAAAVRSLEEVLLAACGGRGTVAREERESV